MELEQYPTGPHIASRMLYTVSAATCVLPRFRSFPALLQDAMYLSFLDIALGCGAGLSCDSSGIMELGATKCSFDSESTELLSSRFTAGVGWLCSKKLAASVPCPREKK